MKTLIILLLSLYAYGQEDTLGGKLVKELGTRAHVEEEVIDLCMTHFDASFNGGNEALMEYIAQKLTYTDCAKSHISGKIYVSFTVELDGELTDIQVHRSPCPDMDAVIIELFDKMPLWSPASDSKRGGMRSIVRIPIQICFI